MPEVSPNSAPMPRAGLYWDGTTYRVGLCDAAAHLQVDTLSSALPVGAATEVTLAAVEGWLALLDNLRQALFSMDGDKLLVRGKDQLFSYKGMLRSSFASAISGAGGYVESATPPANEVWCLTRISAKDNTTATTGHSLRHNRAGGVMVFDERVGTFALNTYSFGPEIMFLDPGDVIRVQFTGGAAGDTCTVQLFGYIMTKE